MNRIFVFAALALPLTLSLAACGEPESPIAQPSFRSETVRVVAADESALDVQVEGRVVLSDGNAWTLSLKGARYTLEVTDSPSDAGGSVISELRDGADELLALGEFHTDGSSTLMNAEGVQVLAAAGTDPLADTALAGLFDRAVPTLLDASLLEALDALTAESGIVAHHSALMSVGTGLSCASKCSAANGAQCC